MLNDNFKEVLELVSGRLNSLGIKWMLVGSTNLSLQGININPRDLDIVVRFDDLRLVGKSFSDFALSRISRLEPIYANEAWDLKVNINGIEVQFVAELDGGVYVRELVGGKFVQLNGVNCFDLETEASVYSKTNRENRAELIRTFLRNR